MNKKILSLVLVLALVLGSFNLAFAATAKDVAGTDVEEAVSRLGKLNILKGYPDGTFKPENTITRAEFATAVARARGFEQSAQNSKGDTPFTDVTASHWASGYVNASSKAGLVNGVGNGLFAPEAQITYEQAVTLVVRALGYEEAAKTLGGYPQGHLSVASTEGLLDGVKGTQGTPATRGLVAQLLDNALDIPKMIQVGYGDSAKWVVSGNENTDEKYLFDDLGLERLEEAIITNADSDKNKITVDGKKHKNDSKTVAKTLKTETDFNFAGYEGLKGTVWYDKNDTLIDIKLSNDYTVKFDGVKVTKEATSKKQGELELITEDKKYDLDQDAVVYIKGEKEDTDDLLKDDEYNFAKIILNEYNDISRIDVYDLDEIIVVDKAEKDLIKGYDSEELDDADDYTIIKDGKQVKAEDLQNKDIVLYNTKAEYAAVVTNTKEGEIDRVYKDGFKFGKDTYDLHNDKYGYIKYINNKNLEEVDSDVLEEMQDNGKVKLYFSFDDKVVFIDGKAEQVASNYAMVKEDSLPRTERGKTYYNVEVLNSEGKVVEYKEIDAKDIPNDIFDGTVAEFEKVMKKENVVELSTNSSNEVTKVKPAKSADITKTTDVDATSIAGFKAQSKAVVFWKDGESKIKDYTVLTWGEAEKEFTEVTVGTVYADKDDRVVAIFAERTNNETKTKDVTGIVTEVKERSKKDDRYDVTISVNDKETTYEAKDSSFSKIKVDQIVTLSIVDAKNNSNAEAKSWKLAKSEVVTVDRASSNKLETKNGKYKDYIIEGKYYEETKRGDFETINSKDVVGEKVTLYFESESDRRVAVVVLGDFGSTEPEEPGTEEPTELTATAKSENIFGQEVVTVELSDSTKLGEVSELKVNGTVVEFEVKNGKVAARADEKATEVKLTLKDGTVVEATIK